MNEGCQERFDWGFLQYVYNYNKTRKPKILQKLEVLKAQKQVYRLKRNQEVNHFLQRLNG